MEKKLFRQPLLYGNNVEYDKSQIEAHLGFYINSIFIIFHSRYEARITSEISNIKSSVFNKLINVKDSTIVLAEHKNHV